MPKTEPIIEGTNSCSDEEWTDIINNLTTIMNKRNPSNNWKAKVKNFGWRSASGEKTFKAITGEEMLRNILPNTECHFKIYKFKKTGLKINNAHHDSPCWNEWYYITKNKEITD